MAALAGRERIGLGIVVFVTAFTILVFFFPLARHVHQMNSAVAAFAICYAFGAELMGFVALGAVIVPWKEGMGSIDRLGLVGGGAVGSMTLLTAARGIMGIFMGLMAIFAGLSAQHRRFGVDQVLRRMAIRAGPRGNPRLCMGAMTAFTFPASMNIDGFLLALFFLMAALTLPRARP